MGYVTLESQLHNGWMNSARENPSEGSPKGHGRIWAGGTD